MIKWVVVGLAGAMAAVLAIIGVMTLTGKIPDTKFVRWQDLNDENQAFLQDEILGEGETVTWIYSAGLLTLREDGNLLTNQRVITFGEYENGWSYSYVWLEDITAVRAKYGSTLIDGDLYLWQEAWIDEETGEIRGGPDEQPLYLFMSAEDGLDHTFVKAVVRTAKRAGADIQSVELGGSISARERRAIDGASEFEGDDWEAPPSSLLRGALGPGSGTR